MVAEDRFRSWAASITYDVFVGLVFGLLVAVVELHAAWVTTGRFDLSAALAIGVWDGLMFGIASLGISPLRHGLERLLVCRIPILALLLGLVLTARITGDAVFSVLPDTHTPDRALPIGLSVGLVGGVLLAVLASLVLQEPRRCWPSVFIALSALLYTSFYWRSAVHASGPVDLLGLVAVSVLVAVLAIWLAARSPQRVSHAAIASVLLLSAAGRAAVGPAPLSQIMSNQGASKVTSTSGPSAAKPNLVMIVLDTVRADHLDLYGYTRQTMPNLTRFSRRATVFTDCTASSSWTLPSHASLFTGLPSRVHGVHEHGAVAPVEGLRGLVPLGDDRVTLAEVLRDGGYQTAGIVANFLYLKPKYGLHQGFEYWDSRPSYRGAMSEGYFPLVLRTRTLVDATPLRFLNEPFIAFDIAQPVYERATSITNRAIERVAALGESTSPFFLFLNYMDAHDIYQAPGKYADYFPGRDPNLPRYRHGITRMHLPDERVRVHMMAQYDSELAYLDAELGRLFADLERRGLLDETLIVVTSDHGEGFLEHGTLIHGHSLYQGEVHVPLVIYDPLTQEGEVVESPVSITALTPWLLGRLGFHLPEGLQAIPELPAFGPVVAELYDHPGVEGVTVIRQQRLKLAVFSSGEIDLYDLHADPEEREPLKTQRAAAVRSLLEALNHWKEANPETILVPRSLSEADREQLRMLGYAE